MHQIQFPLGFRTKPRWGAYSARPDPLAVFKGPTSKGREGKESGAEGGREEKGEGRREEGMEREKGKEGGREGP